MPNSINTGKPEPKLDLLNNTLLFAKINTKGISEYPVTVIRTEERDKYMEALEQASTEGRLNDFVKIISEAVDISLDMYLYMVK